MKVANAFFGAAIILGLGYAGFASAQEAPSEFDVCHQTGPSWNHLNTPDLSAYNGHIGHGDFDYAGPIGTTQEMDQWCEDNAPDTEPTLGSITIDKVVIGESADNEIDFNFDVSWSAQDVSLSGSDTPVASGDLAPGTYTIDELTLPIDWALESMECTNNTGTMQIGGIIEVDVAEGEAVTCVVTNRYYAPTVDLGTGSITIMKQTNDETGGQTQFDFTGTSDIGAFDVLGNNADYETFPDVPAGSVTITEGVEAGWDFSSVSCSNLGDTEWDAYNPGDSNVVIDVADGDNITCVFVNTIDTNPELGSITIIKEATPEDGTDFSFTFGDGETILGFMLDDMGEGDDADSVSQSNTFNNLAAGSYIVNELVPEGWVLADISCSEGSVIGHDEGESDIEVVLAEGQDVTCTYTNRELPRGDDDDDSGDDDDDSGDDDDDDDNGGGGGGSSRRRGGSSDSSDEGEVLGEQITIVPAGAPATGMGGAAQSYTSFGSFIALFAGLKF